MGWRTIKPLRRRVLIEEGLAKSYKSSTQRTQTSGIFVKQVVFCMVNDHGPLPLKELHSTGETIVWRDPGGSWACLLPVYNCVWNHPATGCDMWTTPKKHTKKRETLGNAKQNLKKSWVQGVWPPLKSSTRRTQASGIFVKQVVFRTVNHRGPLPLKELHSTGETIVWRDPGGSWACLPPVYKCNHPATCGIHPKQHTKKRGTRGNTKRPKPQEEDLGCG